MATLAEILEVGLPLTIGLALISLAVFIFQTARDRVYNVVFSALYGLSGIKSISEGIIPVANTLRTDAPLFPSAQAWNNVAAFCAFYMVPLIVLFILLFPKTWMPLRRNPVLGSLLFVPSIAFTYLIFVDSLTLDPISVLLVFSIVASLATALALVVLWRNRLTTRSKVDRSRAGYLLAGFMPAFAATWVLSVMLSIGYWGGVRGVAEPVRFIVAYVSPVLELAAAALVGYAIVKYQLLGIELQVKIGLKYAMTTVILFGTLFIVSGAVEEFFLEELFGFTELNWLIAGVAGVAMFKPVEKGANFVTNRMFPDTMQAKESYVDKRAAEIYQAQASYVFRDENVTHRERAFLKNLRTQLGLSEAEAVVIERQVQAMADEERGGSRTRRGSQAA